MRTVVVTRAVASQYAKLWLKHGPEKATQIIFKDKHRYNVVNKNAADGSARGRRLLAECEDDNAAVAEAAGAWGVTQCEAQYCEGQFAAMMAPMCKKTCGLCSAACEDDNAAVAEAAGAWGVTQCEAQYCEGQFAAMMAPMCKRTCGLCSDGESVGDATVDMHGSGMAMPAGGGAGCTLAPGPMGGAHQVRHQHTFCHSCVGIVHNEF